MEGINEGKNLSAQFAFVILARNASDWARLQIEQVHLNCGSSGIALWPQLSHCNQPSDCDTSERNSVPVLQYGQRAIGSTGFGITWRRRDCRLMAAARSQCRRERIHYKAPTCVIRIASFCTLLYKVHS